MRKIYIVFTSLLIVIALSFVIQKEVFAVIADPTPIQYKQPDGIVVTIKLKGDEQFSWAETLDGYTLLSDRNNGWAYAVLNSDGDLVFSGILAHNQEARTTIETSLLTQIPKKLRYSQKQIEDFKSSTDARLKSATAATAFTPAGSKKLLLILIDFTDQSFNSPLTAHADFNGLLNTVGYSANNAHGSVHDFFYETSYGNFDLTTDVVGPFHAAHNMAYYGENVGSNHSPKAGELITEAVIAANPYVNYADYANLDGTVEGVYVVYAGYGEATSGLTYTIWPHASTIPTQTLDGVQVSRYSCSNELTAGGTELTTIGVICHEFGHVCGSPDFYDTDYDTNGQFDGTGYWDVMANGVYDGTPSGSLPPHFNPYVKALFGWCDETTEHPRLKELNTAGTYTIPDIISSVATTPQIYKINTKTSGEYFLIENRQQTGFNADIPGHGLMIYHKNAGEYNTDKNMKHPQGFYPVCANASTNPSNNPDDYGDINSAGCSFPGSNGVHGFYDTGTPSAKSWTGVNTDMPITNIAENLDGTVSFTISTPDDCGTAPTTQATSFAASPTIATSMDISWTRGDGDKVLVVAREGSAVDFHPVSGTSYTANANFKSGSELGAGNYVVYDDAGTSVTLTGLNGNTQYFFAVYEYNSTTNCYLKPALTGSGTTNCNQGALPFDDDFERNSFGCWTVVDNQGNGQVWQLGTYSAAENVGFTGNYAYLPCARFGSGNAQNADLISPAFDLSSYSSVKLKFNHYYRKYTGTSATVSYSIDNGSTWNVIKAYSASTANPEVASFSVPATAGHSQVQFKWNFTSTDWGYYWSVDDVQVIEEIADPSGFTATLASGSSTSEIDLSWTKNILSNDVIVAWAPTNTFGTPVDGTAYVAGASIPGGGTVLYKGSLAAFNHTSLSAGTTYYYKIWSVTGTNLYSIGLTPISETTDCEAISVLPFEENFTSGSLPGCWKLKDNTGQGNWQFGTTSNVNYTPALTGNYTYFSSVYGVAHNYNADLISPTLNLTSYSNVVLKFNQLFDRSSSYTSTGTVSYSIDNGVTWTSVASYSNADSPNPEAITLSVSGVAGRSQVKFKWNYACSPTGAYMWAVDDIKVTSTDFPTVTTVPVTGVSSTSASAGGNVTSIGASSVTAKGVCWSTSPNPTVNDSKTTDGTGTGAYRSNITGLTANTLYYMRAYATNTNGTSYGTQATFVAPPVAVTATSVTASGFIANWNASSNATNYSLDVSSTPFGNTALFENFNGFLTSGFPDYSTALNNYLLSDGWTGSPILDNIGSAIINSSSGGYICTPALDLSGNGGNYTLYFDLGPYSTGVSKSVIVSHSANGGAYNTIATVSIPTGSTTQIVQITGGSSNSKIKIASPSGGSSNRFTIDNIKIEASNMLTSYTNLSVTGTMQAVIVPSAGIYYYRVRANGTSSTSISSNAISTPKLSIVAGGNWNNPATWSPSGVPVAQDNVLILSPGTVVVDVTHAVCQELAIQNGAKLVINPLQALTVSNALTNNSDATGLMIKSDAAGTGSLIAGSASGQATTELYMIGSAWHVVSPTAIGGSISTFIQEEGNAIPSKTGSYAMMDYNETGNSWNSYYTSSTSENLSSGKGYSVRRTADGVVTFTGTLTSGTKTISLTKTGTEGWNCVGNPYTSAIYLNTAANAANNFLKTNAIDASNLDASYACIYVWDQDALGYKILGNVSYGLRNLEQNIFQSGQGFFVKANNSSSSIEFTPAMQVHQPNALLKSAEASWPGFELTVATTQTNASTMVAFNNSMTSGLDPTYDAGLLRGTSGLNLYTHLVDDNGVDFAIQCLPESYNALVIPVGLESKTGGEITFSAQTVELPAACSIILEDKRTKIFTSLADGGTYNATVSAGTTAVGRFYIHTNSSTTGTSEQSSGVFSLKAYPANGQIWIIGEVSSGTKASIFDVNGRNLGTFNLQEGSRNSISASGLAAGVYLLNVTEASKRFNSKVVIY